MTNRVLLSTLLALMLASCGGGTPEFDTPDKTVTAYLDAKIAGDDTAVQRTLSKTTPPAFDMAEGVDFPAGKDSGYASYQIVESRKDAVGAQVDVAVTFNDGTKANRRFFVALENDNYRITNYAWIP